MPHKVDHQLVAIVAPVLLCGIIRGYEPTDSSAISVPPWDVLMCSQLLWWCYSTGKAESSFYFRPHSNIKIYEDR